MEERRLGRSGLRVSRVGLGTMTWGRDTDEHEAAEQLRAFLDAGGTLLDTAPGYGDGTAEALVGRLLVTAADFSDVVLCTKAGVRVRAGQGLVDASRRALLASLDTSLVRLGTDHVDLFLVQAYDPGVPLEETLAALHEAVASGRTRYVGVCNHSGWQLARAATAGAATGTPLTVDQVELSLLDRSAEAEVIPAATATGAGVVGWSPLGRGVLTGKYRTGTPADSRAASPHLSGFVRRYLDPRAARIVEAVATAAEGLEATAVEVALAWARDAPGVASVVVGARTAAQLRGSLSAEDLVLPPEIRRALDDVSGPM